MSQVPQHDPCSTAQSEARLYVPDQESWSAAIKRDWNKEYCFAQNPGEDFYHLLLAGEIYLQRGAEKYCLNCAMRHGVLSRDRTYWQKGPSSVSGPQIVFETEEGGATPPGL